MSERENHIFYIIFYTIEPSKKCYRSQVLLIGLGREKHNEEI